MKIITEFFKTTVVGGLVVILPLMILYLIFGELVELPSPTEAHLRAIGVDLSSMSIDAPDSSLSKLLDHIPRDQRWATAWNSSAMVSLSTLLIQTTRLNPPSAEMNFGLTK